MNHGERDVNKISVILPARNEAANLRPLLEKLTAQLPGTEIVVVDDGSTDGTAAVCQEYGVRVVTHPYSMGNGAAVKAGARRATGDVLVFMDADGQHDPADIPRLLAKLAEGYAMAVGARRDHSQASWGRSVANRIYNRLASWMANYPVLDLTSGFRAVRADRFREFLYLLPNGFSYPTTITMAFFRSGYPVGYVPIVAGRREGKSHIQPLQDGVRFLLIIFKIGTLYSPLKLFFPISLGFFLLGLGYYAHTFVTQGRFTNMGVLLFSVSVVVFLMGLVSEQITSLFYQQSDGNIGGTR
ncbi:glycosyltransferase family 2 protein [Candidatus Contendibacter odensensis]|uniref:Glycosyl transferase family 2 n=1 Tax=Candidatus Contendobacter odensis Run_B_J11 TaxID=1400861 RepID=A0A7U7GC27_9GAMM|nr:Glycosyl transferase family 2 [Candidatus Contendobacter odensis Run_B_J11]